MVPGLLEMTLDELPAQAQGLAATFLACAPVLGPLVAAGAAVVTTDSIRSSCERILASSSSMLSSSSAPMMGRRERRLVARQAGSLASAASHRAVHTLLPAACSPMSLRQHTGGILLMTRSSTT